MLKSRHHTLVPRQFKISVYAIDKVKKLFQAADYSVECGGAIGGGHDECKDTFLACFFGDLSMLLRVLECYTRCYGCFC
jgi:hypothetical protein